MGKDAKKKKRSCCYTNKIKLNHSCLVRIFIHVIQSNTPIESYDSSTVVHYPQTTKVGVNNPCFVEPGAKPQPITDYN